jgi:hypothetical protein
VLAERFADGAQSGDVTADLSYHETDDGRFEPVISVSIFPADGFGTPTLTEYSLSRGLLENESDTVDG